jgi:hypothetical protein
VQTQAVACNLFSCVSWLFDFIIIILILSSDSCSLEQHGVLVILNTGLDNVLLLCANQFSLITLQSLLCFAFLLQHDSFFLIQFYLPKELVTEQKAVCTKH